MEHAYRWTRLNIHTPGSFRQKVGVLKVLAYLKLYSWRTQGLFASFGKFVNSQERDSGKQS